MDTDKPYRDAAAAVLRQMADVASATDHEGMSRSQGAYDVAATLASSEHAASIAVEVTRLVDGPTLGTFNELRKTGRTFTIPAHGTWEALLGSQPVRVKALVRDLGQVAVELESVGVHRADPLTWTLEPSSRSVDWPQLRALFERMEPFSILDLSRVKADGGSLQVRGPVYGGLASPEQLCAGIAERANAKAAEVRGRADEAWLFVWIDWTNVLPGRVIRPDAAMPLPDIPIPEAINRVVASVTSFDARDDRLPVAEWRPSVAPARTWVARGPVDECFC